MSDKHVTYIDRALVDPARSGRMAALGLAASYAAGSGRLSAGEEQTLEGKQLDKRRRRNTAKMTTAGQVIADAMLVMLETVNDVPAYANSFNTKHTTAALSSVSARATANARANHPHYATVYQTAYFETLLVSLATGLADGNQVVSRRASLDGDDIRVVEYYNASYRNSAVGIYSYDLHFSIATDRAARARTITASHMQTS